ncbi:aromatic ring-hydroxylating oxygenase subunit alpha [Sphingobium lactosutens]|uniref:aromatic ring-hydroxylating oxygenase subunit alpha n=1 Tax=Sphingobium lactosutens TaxID=522773 RepID=UPI0015B7DBE6|nr:aromatic ring-hydroxylating dioxygenase subunit alpha [Sphingobium lactosutens]
MKHETQVEMIRQLLDHIDEKIAPDCGKILACPVSTFTDPDRAAKERDILFRNHPQIIGLSGDLPKPGSFLTNDDLGIPILATRNKDGKFRAFLNGCRHRGAKVTSQSRGEQSRFVCPYHAWSYNNDGRLLAVRESAAFGDVDKDCNGLIELPAQEKYGLLVVHPNRNGTVDIDSLLGQELAEEFATWQFDKAVYRGEMTIDRPLNWKLGSDTFCETYHFAILHRDTVARVNFGDYTPYRRLGNNHCIAIATRSIETVRNQPTDSWNLPSVSTLAYYLYPNVHIILTSNVVSLTRLYPHPTDPGQSITRIWMYQVDHVLPKQNDDQQLNAVSQSNAYEPDFTKPLAYDTTALRELFESTVDAEDFTIACDIQKVAESGMIDVVKFGRNEPGVQNPHNQIREAIGLPPMEEYRDPVVV